MMPRSKAIPTKWGKSIYLNGVEETALGSLIIALFAAVIILLPRRLCSGVVCPYRRIPLAPWPFVYANARARPCSKPYFLMVLLARTGCRSAEYCRMSF
jgi:hypothetical protein